MRFVMLGAGAIGGVVGGQLAKAGFDVLFVDPLEEHVAAINRNGLQRSAASTAPTRSGWRR